MYADVRNGNLQYADVSQDTQMGVAVQYRSYAFVLDRGKFTGTITVFDYMQTTKNIMILESLMRHQAMPIMSANAHCYEPPNAFWTTYYRSLTTQPITLHEGACSWLLTKISVDKNEAGTPRAQPLDKDKQMCIFTLGKAIFNGNTDSWESSWANFKTQDKDWGIFNNSTCKDVDSSDHHPRTHPEGGYRVHYSIAYSDDADFTSKAVSYAYEPERTTIAKAMTAIASMMVTLLPGGAKAGETYPQYTDTLTASANAILNNDQDQYDAYTDWLTELPPSSDAIFIFGQAETARIARISAISKLTAEIQNERAKSAIAAYTKIAPPSPFTRALSMLFTVRENPAIVPVTDAYFQNYPALHQLAMQMCKDSYSQSRTSPVHPATKQVAYHQTTGDLASAPEYAVYFMPTLYEAGTDIAGPTIFIAFRGTKGWSDLIGQFSDHVSTGRPTHDIFPQIAAFMSPYSDLLTDMSIFLGTQAESARFQDSDALVQTAAKYKMNIILTGHSLGGAIATHCLEANSVAVTAAIVFNPARGMDDTYFDQVVNDETIASVRRNTMVTDVEALPVPYSDGDEGGVSWIVPPNFSAEDDLKARKITGIVIPGTVTTVFISDSGTWHVTYQWAATKAGTLTATVKATGTRTTIDSDTPLAQDDQGHWTIPATFSAEEDFKGIVQGQGITGIVVPGSEDLDFDSLLVKYDHVSFSAADAAADLKKRGINGTFVPNSVRWVDFSAPTVTYDYSYVGFSSQWHDKLVTHRVAGKSASPIDDDPVSVLSGGVGTTYESIKAHTCDNWDTTLVLRDGHAAIAPLKPQ
jgi:hypothetical protein